MEIFIKTQLKRKTLEVDALPTLRKLASSVGFTPKLLCTGLPFNKRKLWADDESITAFGWCEKNNTPASSTWTWPVTILCAWVCTSMCVRPLILHGIPLAGFGLALEIRPVRFQFHGHDLKGTPFKMYGWIP